ncbi:hypothetical protein N7534_003069 [Penicillium rubens]|nr:hypothetical protein N7534_003069 [Penicillium rubens]
MTSFGNGNTEHGIAQGEAPARDAHVEGLAGLRGSRHARNSKAYQIDRNTNRKETMQMRGTSVRQRAKEA